MRVTLDIGRVTVRTEAGRHHLERVAPAIEEAFRLLATRLEQVPLGRIDEARDRLVSMLEIDVLPLDELLSARGAERLADELYRQLVRNRS
jgi:hypothetical protein